MEWGTPIGVAGIALAVGSIWWTAHQSKKSSRSRLIITLDHAFEIDPADFDEHTIENVQFIISGKSVSNLCGLTLSVRLEGYRDHDDPVAEDPPAETDPRRPRIKFVNFRALSIGTQDNDVNAFRIPIGRGGKNHVLHLNVVRIRLVQKLGSTSLGQRRTMLPFVQPLSPDTYLTSISSVAASSKNEAAEHSTREDFITGGSRSLGARERAA
jgi:hypothetical protein